MARPRSPSIGRMPSASCRCPRARRSFCTGRLLTVSSFRQKNDEQTMTGAAAALTTASIAARRAPWNRTLLLLMPAIATLVFMFLMPLALFFVRTFAEFDGSTVEFIDQARDLLLS